jgi:hypothetical protein
LAVLGLRSISDEAGCWHTASPSPPGMTPPPLCARGNPGGALAQRHPLCNLGSIYVTRQVVTLSISGTAEASFSYVGPSGQEHFCSISHTDHSIHAARISKWIAWRGHGTAEPLHISRGLTVWCMHLVSSALGGEASNALQTLRSHVPACTGLMGEFRPVLLCFKMPAIAANIEIFRRRNNAARGAGSWVEGLAMIRGAADIEPALLAAGGAIQACCGVILTFRCRRSREIGTRQDIIALEIAGLVQGILSPPGSQR